MSDASVGSMEVTGSAAGTSQDVVQPTATVEATAPPEAAETTRSRSLSIADLKPKMQLQGKVNKIELYGAFVDIGIGRDALLHISQLSEKRVNNVTDVVKEGDAITVYVLDADKAQGRVSLTLIKPPALTWNEIKLGDIFTGRVVRVENYGAFVDIGAERPGLVHVSELAEEYVGSAETVVKPDDKVQVKVIGVDHRKKQIDLSVRAAEASLAVAEDEHDEAEGLTTMALALRKAMARSEAEARDNKRRKKDKARNAQQDEILARTLQHHKGR